MQVYLLGPDETRTTVREGDIIRFRNLREIEVARDLGDGTFINLHFCTESGVPLAAHILDLPKIENWILAREICESLVKILCMLTGLTTRVETEDVTPSATQDLYVAELVRSDPPPPTPTLASAHAE